MEEFSVKLNTVIKILSEDENMNSVNSHKICKEEMKEIAEQLKNICIFLSENNYALELEICEEEKNVFQKKYKETLNLVINIK